MFSGFELYPRWVPLHAAENLKFLIKPKWERAQHLPENNTMGSQTYHVLRVKYLKRQSINQGLFQITL